MGESVSGLMIICETRLHNDFLFSQSVNDGVMKEVKMRMGRTGVKKFEEGRECTT